MKKIGKQILVDRGGKSLKVEIVPFPNKKDSLTLKIWFVVWTILGLAVLSQFVVPIQEYSGSQKVFLGIYLVLWLYFELKVLHALRWNSNGKEHIEIKDGNFIYTVLIGKRGLPIEYKMEDLTSFHYEASTEKGIWNDINKSIWMVGGEVIQFKHNEKIKRLGRKLPKKDAEQLVQILNKY